MKNLHLFNKKQFHKLLMLLMI
ncbi:UNVERIFIED_CONTAM: hypothetical protein GTU68_018313 [Idotea baltica]|nr:hypothetical protein [Idotea baltica]